MPEPIPTRRSFRPTPAWLIYGLLVVEGVLWLSERLGWLACKAAGIIRRKFVSAET
jgi:hypothetical protein